jgi:4-hydroxy-3-polyprenylbenzoate decarboxylase
MGNNAPLSGGALLPPDGPAEPQRLVVALSGASGAILGIRLLQVLQHSPIETHLIISPAAAQTIASETDWALKEVENLAHEVHPHRDVGATIASGSYKTLGMVIAPCSVKTLSSIAYGMTDDLTARAADVCLKEGRTLIAVYRETPLHVGHLRALTQFAEMGGVVFPPVPAFYARPASIDEMVDQTVGRILDRLGIDNQLVKRWAGLKQATRHAL